MQDDLYISILNSLPEEVIEQLNHTQIEAQCIFTKQPDCEDEQEFVNSSEAYKLQVRGNYIVQCAPNSQKIAGGIKLSLDVQIQILYIQSAFDYDAQKPFAIALFIPDKTQEQELIAIKLGVQISQSEKITKFRNSLQNKEITHINLYRDFQIEQRIFKTDSACIYGAIRKRDKLKVALKCISKEKYQETNRSIKKGQQRQFRMPFLLKHPNICKFYELYHSQSTVAIVMQLLNFNLLQFLRKRGFKSANQFRQILLQIFEAVQYLHSKNIMHRDLKLENIMMKQLPQKEDTYKPKIIDFGLAQYEGVKPYIFNKCGTPGYTAPEILGASGEEGNYTKACDLFSLGCIFYSFLMKKPLFIAQSLEQLIKMNKQFVLDKDDPRFTYIHSSAKDLLFGLIIQDPNKRLNIKQAISHKFFTQEIKEQESVEVSKSTKSDTEN